MSILFNFLNFVIRAAFRCGLFVLLFSIFSFASAHVTGNSWEQVNGRYKIDIGYDQNQFVAGQPVRFDFSALEARTGEPADFSSVWVRVVKGSTTVFATGLHRPALGPASMTFTFPDAGDYSLDVRFDHDLETVTEQNFPITVLAAPAPALPTAAHAIAAKAVLAWGGWVVALVFVALRLFTRTKKPT